MFPRFSDIGYKYTLMQNGVAICDYIQFLESIEVAWCKKEYDEWTEYDIKEFQNTMARLKILSFLNNIPEEKWNSEHNKLFKHVISDVDFYASERQFNEIFEQKCSLI